MELTKGSRGPARETALARSCRQGANARVRLARWGLIERCGGAQAEEHWWTEHGAELQDSTHKRWVSQWPDAVKKWQRSCARMCADLYDIRFVGVVKGGWRPGVRECRSAVLRGTRCGPNTPCAFRASPSCSDVQGSALANAACSICGPASPPALPLCLWLVG